MKGETLYWVTGGGELRSGQVTGHLGSTAFVGSMPVPATAGKTVDEAVDKWVVERKREIDQQARILKDSSAFSLALAGLAT